VSEAAELVKHAMRLSPIHSAWYLAVLAHAYRLMLRYDEAVDVYKQAIALAPNQIAAHLGLTSCYARAGQLELARIQGREILRVSPKLHMATYAQSLTYKDPEDSRSRSWPRPSRLLWSCRTPPRKGRRAPYCPFSWLLWRRSTVAAMSGISLTR
jgi:tetratricopeptide (TPR) repeat protein